jgi:glycosyltransferase involved in cell wall biosynthesis
VVDHTSLLAGGGRSLLELLAGLPDGVEATLACPPGALADAAAGVGVSLSPVRGTAGSFRLHPQHSTRAVVDLAAMAVAVRRHARHMAADVVHANSTRAGLATVLARRLGAPPTVVHVRDVLPPGRAARAVRGMLRRGAAEVIAISRHVAEAFGEGPKGRLPRVIHNAVDLERFSPTMSREEARGRLGLPRDGLVASVVAQITPWKGQLEVVEAFAQVRQRHPGAILLIAGEAKFVNPATRYDNAAYERTLRERVAQLGLHDNVRFLGERDDVPEILRASDVTLLASWEEPFGRTVAEAMAAGTPVIATSIGGPAEIVDHDVDGILLEPRQPLRWGRELLALLDDPERRERLAAHARARAVASFGREAHVGAVMEVWRAALSSP